MAVDIRKTVLALAEAALRDSSPEPKHKPHLSTGKAVLLGAGLATAGRYVATARGRELMTSIQQFLVEHEAPRGGDDDGYDEDYDEDDYDEEDYGEQEPEAEADEEYEDEDYEDEEPQAEADEDDDDADYEDDEDCDDEEPQAEADDDDADYEDDADYGDEDYEDEDYEDEEPQAETDEDDEDDEELTEEPPRKSRRKAATRGRS